MIWSPTYECMSRDEMRTLAARAAAGDGGAGVRAGAPVPGALPGGGHRPGGYPLPGGRRRLPFLTKQDMRDALPYGLFASPMAEVVRIHASSGTTGRPTAVGYSRGDLELWAEAMALIVTAAGVTAEDIAHVAFGYGLFTGAFGLHYALEKVGASVLPVSGGNTERQVEIMASFGSTVLVRTPSYALRIAEVIGEMGMRPERPEAAPGPLRRRALVRGDAPGDRGPAGGDSHGQLRPQRAHRPGHLRRVLRAVRPPHQRGPLPAGDRGPGHPGAAARGLPGGAGADQPGQGGLPGGALPHPGHHRLTYEPCRCGRTTARMERVTGRTDDMLIVRGVNVFPSQIEAVLLEVEGTAPHYQIVLTREGSLDEIELRVEVSEGSSPTRRRRCSPCGTG